MDGRIYGAQKVAQIHVKLNKMKNLHKAYKKALKTHKEFSLQPLKMSHSDDF